MKPALRFAIAIAIASALALALAIAPALVGPGALAQSSGASTGPIVDEPTLKREYESYRASLAGMKRYGVSYIRVTDEAQARELLAKIRSGADFGRIAREKSTHEDSARREGLLVGFVLPGFRLLRLVRQAEVVEQHLPELFGRCRIEWSARMLLDRTRQ